MKLSTKALFLISLALSACASAGTTDRPENTDQTTRSEERDAARRLVVGAKDNARQVLDAVPEESAMERFHMVDADGHTISYVAFTDTDTGGLVFVDGTLLGTVSRRDAQAFYSCRGYATATQAHWAKEAPAWVAGLVAATTPATEVTLHFSGKSTPQSLKEMANTQLLAQLSMFDISTNPLSLLRKLNAAHDSMVEREKYDKTLQALKSVIVASNEEKLAATLTPEDVLFGDGGFVMAYPRFSFEFYVSGGTVKVAQQPSFYRLSRIHPALFYAPNAKWDLCTPKNWREALPESKSPAEKVAK